MTPPAELDAIKISFNPDTVWVVNLIIAVIMFGVALDLKAEDFKRILKQPTHFDPDGLGPAAPPVPGRADPASGPPDRG